jgi:hypothetical protein
LERISWLPFAFAFATNGIHYGYHVAAKAKAKVEQQAKRKRTATKGKGASLCWNREQAFFQSLSKRGLERISWGDSLPNSLFQQREGLDGCSSPLGLDGFAKSPLEERPSRGKSAKSPLFPKGDERPSRGTTEQREEHTAFSGKAKSKESASDHNNCIN